MSTARDRAITELMLAKELIELAALNVSVDLISGASVESVKARDAIIQALAELEQETSEVDSCVGDYIPETLTLFPC